MKKETHIALIGFRASGKSLVGKLLAEELHLSFVDMDAQLGSILGMTIDQWVHANGWDSFRHAESELLERLVREEGLVVATGGGVVLTAPNREILKKRFLVVWLKATPETTYVRMLGDPDSGTNRPAFTTLPLREEIRQILVERSALYQETADIILETDDRLPEQLVSVIKRHLAAGKKAGDEKADEPRK